METDIAPSLAFARKLELHAKTGQACGIMQFLAAVNVCASTVAYETNSKGFAMSDLIALGQSSITDGSVAMHREVQAMMRYDANQKSVGVTYVLCFFFGTLGSHGF
jgi:hypothetical protein